MPLWDIIHVSAIFGQWILPLFWVATKMSLTINFDMHVFPLGIDSQLQTIMERSESLGDSVPILMCRCFFLCLEILLFYVYAHPREETQHLENTEPFCFVTYFAMATWLLNCHQRHWYQPISMQHNDTILSHTHSKICYGNSALDEKVLTDGVAFVVLDSFKLLLQSLWVCLSATLLCFRVSCCSFR